MKSDFNTIIYIVISIAILVISGLSGARRRKAQQLKTTPNRGSTPQGMNAMDRLEQMFTGQLGYDNIGEAGILEEEEESMEDEPVAEDISLMTDEEGKTVFEDKQDATDTNFEEIFSKGQEEQEEQDITTIELFSDVDEFKKAVIYSEIFRRKYT